MTRIIATRRKVLIGALATAAGAAIPAPFSALRAAGPRKRRNIEALGADELSAYEHAIKILKDRSAADPDDRTGYLYWASLHDHFDASAHSGCAHYSEKFLPWHRRLLYDFEAALQQTDPPTTANVMIPYWDWSLPPRNGVHFPSAFENQSSPLFVRRNSTSPPPWDSVDLRELVQERDWTVLAGKPDPSDQFGKNPGSIEYGPHNTLHSNISRLMASPETAVQDPIFWSFHAGIDLTWSRWQRLNVSAGSPQPFLDPAAQIWFQDRSYSVVSTASTANLGYEYEYDFSADGPPPSINDFAARARVASVSAPPRRVSRLGSPGGTPRPATTSGANVVLRLGDVRVFHDKSYRLHLYLHPQNVAVGRLAPAARRRYLMRTITLWRAHHDDIVEIFVRPPSAGLAQLGQGWTVTALSEDVAGDDAPLAHGAHAPLATSRAPASQARDLFGSIELQER